MTTPCPYLPEMYEKQIPTFAFVNYPSLPPAPPNKPNKPNKPKYTIIRNSYIHRFFKYHNRPVWYLF